MGSINGYLISLNKKYILVCNRNSWNIRNDAAGVGEHPD